MRPVARPSAFTASPPQLMARVSMALVPPLPVCRLGSMVKLMRRSESAFTGSEERLLECRLAFTGRPHQPLATGSTPPAGSMSAAMLPLSAT